MPREYRAKPELGALSQQVMGKADEPLLKAQAMASLPVPITFTLNNLLVTITDLSVDRGALRVDLQATRNGRSVSINLPYLYQNPPINVHDGTYHKGKSLEGEDIDVRNYVEDLNASLISIVTDTLKGQI